MNKSKSYNINRKMRLESSKRVYSQRLMFQKAGADLTYLCKMSWSKWARTEGKKQWGILAYPE